MKFLLFINQHIKNKESQNKLSKISSYVNENKSELILIEKINNVDVYIDNNWRHADISLK